MKKIFLLVLLIGIAACGTSPASVTDVSTTQPTSIPPTASHTPEPTAEPTHTPEPTSAFLSFPSANCCKARTVEAGEYELPSWFVIPLTMEVDEGWGVMNEEAARLFLLTGKGRNEFNDPSQVLVFIAIPDGNPQDVLTSIRNSSQLSPTGEIAETTIAGFSGWQFGAAAKPNPENKGSPAESIPPGAQPLPALSRYFAPGFLWTTWTAEPLLHFIALNVGEQVLLLQIESPPAEFGSFASEANRLLETLKLTK